MCGGENFIMTPTHHLLHGELVLFKPVRDVLKDLRVGEVAVKPVGHRRRTPPRLTVRAKSGVSCATTPHRPRWCATLRLVRSLPSIEIDPLAGS